MGVRKRTIIVLAAVAAFLLLFAFASLGYLDYTRAREFRRRSEGAIVVRKMANAILQHTESHPTDPPADTPTLSRRLMQAGFSLISPNERTANAKYSYIHVLPAETSVTGPPGRRPPFDPRDALIYEKPENYGGAGTVVGYMDGHALWYTLPELRQELADIAKRRGLSTSQPTTAPIEVE